MISKDFTTLTALVYGHRSYRKFEKRYQNIVPNVNAEEWSEQILLGSNGVRFETCWHKSDDSTPACIRVDQGHCSRPIARSEFSKQTIETPHGWTIVTGHSCSHQYLDNILLNGLIAGGMGRKESQTRIFTSRPRVSSEAKLYLIRKVGNHRSFLTFITSGIPTRFMKVI